MLPCATTTVGFRIAKTRAPKKAVMKASVPRKERPWQLSIFAPLSINRRGLSFLGTLAFMTAFFGARVFAILNPTVVVAQRSIHFHHFWDGSGLITLAGWLGIAFNRPRLVRTYAIIFGLGAW